MQKRKILFLGESYRADAITWMNGLKEFGDFDIITWELQTPNLQKTKRIYEFCTALFAIKKIVQKENPDMVIAERTTSYGFLAAYSGAKIIAVAQQGRTDLWPENSILLPFKKYIQKKAFQKATLIHAWGPVMAESMQKIGVDINKVLVLPKGINLDTFTPIEKKFQFITAIVTRSLQPEYNHETILNAFGILHQKGIYFSLLIVGDGNQLKKLKNKVHDLQIDKKVTFTGRIANTELPQLLQKSNIYLSMPVTEGVSASLFEAMACNCYPIVSEIPGNQSWISHQKNGHLIPTNEAQKLADALLWTIQNPDLCEQAISENLKMIENKANYAINMKYIATKYHELIEANSSKTN
ncbi:glycosyltransferase [Flavobacterium agrisoli]|uniref:Glycosyltransferase n=1 Tax=Flavobacterium agrisoli TaxID=2793066 RepID=A0A934PP34_9FLAO|nr:glycosyltransferase [Flavobacterium agrisoli]MBK0370824.1 glycosyltransferase [Flavobacterium agrisoli]